MDGADTCPVLACGGPTLGHEDLQWASAGLRDPGVPGPGCDLDLCPCPSQAHRPGSVYTNFPSSPRQTSCASCPNTSAVQRAWWTTMEAVLRACARAHAASGRLGLGPLHRTTAASVSFTLLRLPFSPGRTSGTFDNEIVMMNHVYRERFPKVCPAAATSAGLLHCLAPPPSLAGATPSATPPAH